MDIKGLLFKILTYPLPLRVAIARRMLKKLPLLSYEDRLSIGLTDRQNYGYCIFQAAKLATLLGYPRISVIEFGCGGGNGMLSAEAHIAEIMKIFPVEIELYGFDAGSGLPNPRDYRDMPYYFKVGLYRMDRQSLERKLERGRLVIGDVSDTCATFFEKYNPAPIGCMFHDLDFYSSTADALRILDSDSSHYLPRVFMYFDDIIGGDLWACNKFTGERLAIAEFNQKHGARKICKNYYLPLRYPTASWSHEVFIYHDFEHPRYNDFIAQEDQIAHEKDIRLRSDRAEFA
jgi:hypothetical protein